MLRLYEKNARSGFNCFCFNSIANDGLEIPASYKSDYPSAWRLLCLLEPELVNKLSIDDEEQETTLKSTPLDLLQKIRNLTDDERLRFFEAATNNFMNQIYGAYLFQMDRIDLSKRQRILMDFIRHR